MVKPQFQWLLNFQSTTKTSPKNVHERVMHKFNQKKNKKKNEPPHTRAKDTILLVKIYDENSI